MDSGEAWKLENFENWDARVKVIRESCSYWETLDDQGNRKADIVGFLEAAEKFAREYGEPARVTNICGKVGYIPGRIYEDDTIEIQVADNHLGSEVWRQENRNPVVCRREDGEIIRTHGEWIFISEHLRQLIESKKEDSDA